MKKLKNPTYSTLRPVNLKNTKLVFFGSGPVGRATLEGLAKAGFDFEAIITKSRGRSAKNEAPVLGFADARQIAFFTPTNEAELLALFNNHKFDSSIGLVVDYGIHIPLSVIAGFELGILNSHFSLLPEWRGADPITFALLSGQDQTGVSLMLIDDKIDNGRLLAQADYQISTDENIHTLTDNLVELSNKMLIEIIPLYIEGKIALVDQNNSQAPTYSRRLIKKDGIIDWSKSAERLEREVRAYLGWPKSRTTIHGHNIIIQKARVATDENDGDLVIKTGSGWLEIEELIAPSGRKITGADFLRGYSSGR